MDKLNKADHRSVGKKYDLFSFEEYGPGFPFWHSRGLKIKNNLIEYWREVHEENNYIEIQSPQLLDESLWDISGHSQYFKENMYYSKVEKRNYVIKPMSCPGAMLIYKQKKRSHSDLPFRISEVGNVHRNENRGSLNGLLRVRAFSQDDAHIFLKKDDLKDELSKILNIVRELLGRCGFNEFKVELAIREEGKKDYLGEDSDWEFAQKSLMEVAQSSGHDVVIQKGEAKFYGPSLDIHIKDHRGKFWQCSSIQVDFNLPKRFNIVYYDKDGKKQNPFIIHRAIFGSLERFIGILLENYGIDLPFWIAPEKVMILCLDKSNIEYAKDLKNQLSFLSPKIEFVEKNLKQNIKDWNQSGIPYCLIIGNKEVSNRQVLVKDRHGNQVLKDFDNLKDYFSELLY